MEPASTVNTIGHYCGRFGPGLLGEPLNLASNLAYFAGPFYVWRVWRGRDDRDPSLAVVIALAALIGVGSIFLHSAPSPRTLFVDLVSVQLFGLAYLAYVCARYFRLSALRVLGVLALFFAARQLWVRAVPPGLLGGGITHLPTLLLLVLSGALLLRRREGPGGHLLAAAGSYAAALTVRTYDLAVCPVFPIGLHWVWHLLGALTATLAVYGAAVRPPLRRPGPTS